MIYISFFYFFQAAMGYWICRNSCARSYWEGLGHRYLLGIDNFNAIRSNWLWHFVPVVGFIESYKFIHDYGHVRWEIITLRYIKEAWTKF